MTFEVSTWGARGSVTVGKSEPSAVGVNTTSIMVRSCDRIIIIDAGSGIVPLGEYLLKQDVRKIDLIFTHFHFDHISGLPFFAPLMNPDFKTTIWSAGSEVQESTLDVLHAFLSRPFFPVSMDLFKNTASYETFKNGDVLQMGERISVETAAVNHPGGCTAYRVNKDNGKSFAFTGDFEHDDGEQDAALVDFLSGAGLVFADSTYAPHDYERHRGFGHTHWGKAGEICEAANVKEWRLFHHMYWRTGAELLQIEKDAKARFPNSGLAREGDVFEL